MNSFHALILKKRIFRDSDLVLTLLSDKQGRIEVVAKAALKPTSKKSSKIDILNYVYITTVEGKLNTVLTEIKVENNFANIKVGKNIFIVWWYAEILEKLSKLMDAESYKLENIVNSLELANENSEKLEQILAYSVIQLLISTGVNINFANYLFSGESIVEDKPRYLVFDSNNMGFNEKYSLTVEIDNPIYKILKFLTVNSIENICKLEIDNIQSSKLLKIVTLWVENLCGCVVESKKLIF